MVVPEINIWAVLVATASTLVVGSIWYAKPVFGRMWIRSAGLDERELAKRGVGPIVVALLVGFVTAWVLAGAISIAHEFYDGAFLTDAIVTAVLLWAGLTAARFITHHSFEGRSQRLTVLTLGHELVALLVMAVVIGLFGVG